MRIDVTGPVREIVPPAPPVELDAVVRLGGLEFRVRVRAQGRHLSIDIERGEE
jgi:hypothetical protein